MISVVIPVYNEEGNVTELHRRARQELELLGKPYEIIFVDDGSTDRTFEKLKALKPVRILRFQGNHGQTPAMDAGFRAARGDVVVTLDGDLQNDPADIGALLSRLGEGWDVVSGWRTHRHDSLGRRLLSRLANGLAGLVLGLRLHDYACAMKAYRREWLDRVRLYGEMHVILPGVLYGLGARVTEIPVQHHERHSGVSKHYFFKAVKNLIDLFAVWCMVRYFKCRSKTFPTIQDTVENL